MSLVGASMKTRATMRWASGLTIPILLVGVSLANGQRPGRREVGNLGDDRTASGAGPTVSA